MKLFLVLSFVALSVANPTDYYDSKYDNFDVDEMIANDRLLKAYALCFNGGGKCTPEGSEIKNWIPEAMASSCGRCTEKQKTLVAKALEAIRIKLPADYEALMKTYDPENKYSASLEEFIAKYLA